ncbi:MAG: diguanylate cyclase [Synergistaceae bacterium]|nr:diguanylate cyclase [Synergistaceae bacterium]
MGKYKIYRILLGNDISHFSNEKVFDYPSPQALMDDHVSSGIIIIDGLSNKNTENRTNVFETLALLRRSAVFCCDPIYFSHSMGDIDCLSDGITADIQERLTEAETILDRLEKIHSEKLLDNHNLRLMSYMYIRGEAYELKPLCVPFSPWVYVYPVAALLLDNELISPKRLRGEEMYRTCGVFKFDSEMPSSTKIINYLEENGYIEKTEITDRIRRCPKCGTGHLNYIDLCPNCGSIDFEKKTMIHCFTCGHVAPEIDFTRNMSFVCPNCETVLRHLGSDYDHPLESYECCVCGSRFIEPDVKADCFYCRTQTEPEDLAVSNIFSFHISEKGSVAVRTGTMQIAIRLFDDMNNVVFSYFCHTIGWFVNLRKRYPDEAFSVLGIKFSRVYEVEEALGEEFFKELMSEMASRIREMLRNTDMTTSTAPDTFWILLPRTTDEQCNIIARRICALSDLIAVPSVPKISITAKCFAMPCDLSGVSVERQMEIFGEELSSDYSREDA